MPHSIVLRTTICILAPSFLIGLMFTAVAFVRAEHDEVARLEVGLQGLLSAVDSTAQIACFLEDANLAKEISLGILKDHSVSAVGVTAGGQSLFQSPGFTKVAAKRLDTRVISRKVYSPFDQKSIVGEISLYASNAVIRAQARRYSTNLALVLGLQVVIVGVGVAVVVILLVTRPIAAISNKLHALQIDTGMQLRAPRGNQSNEIGRLVSDVNSLLRRLTALLGEERELRVEHERQGRMLKLIIDKAQTGIFVLDHNGVVQSWNPAFARILAFNEGLRIEGAPRLEDLLAPHAREVAGLIEQVLLMGAPGDIDLEISRPGTPGSVWIQLSLNVIGPAALHGVVNDITDRKRVELSSRRLATHDPLTGLLNLRGLESTLSHMLKQVQPGRLALLQIDLDYFKQVNDTYGHDAGDAVLRKVAAILNDSVRANDIVGRHGGDEFMGILVEVETPAQAREIAERMITKIKQPIDIGNGRTAQISASIGIAFSSARDSVRTFRKRADRVMYEAKRGGRAGVRVEVYLADAHRLSCNTRGPGDERR